MRIYDHNVTGGSAAETGRTQDTQKQESTGASRPSQGSNSPDRVEFSNALASLGRILSGSNAERSARVHALVAQYQSGNYKVDSAAVSRAMVADAIEPGRSNG